jgi:SAM-dependent methyltransferase
MLCTMLNRHFAHPQGLLGRLAGRMMARKNATLTHRVIAAAGLRGTETVLEIGCGPGVGLAALAAVLPHGQVLGAEPSAVMRQQAAGRLRAYGDRVHLVDATAGTPPWPAGTVDVVLAVNSVQLWQPLAGSLALVREVLVPGGHLLVGLTEHAVRPDGSTVPADIDSWLVSELATAGFDVVRQEWEPGGNGRELLVAARRAAP